MILPVYKGLKELNFEECEKIVDILIEATELLLADNTLSIDYMNDNIKIWFNTIDWVENSSDNEEEHYIEIDNYGFKYTDLEVHISVLTEVDKYLLSIGRHYLLEDNKYL